MKDVKFVYQNPEDEKLFDCKAMANQAVIKEVERGIEKAFAEIKKIIAVNYWEEGGQSN
jgi:hypothetical protein